jgi:hypothetical protein
MLQRRAWRSKGEGVSFANSISTVTGCQFWRAIALLSCYQPAAAPFAARQQMGRNMKQVAKMNISLNPQMLAPVFWIKWGASILQIAGYAATGFGLAPINIYCFLGGLLGWLMVGVIWRDRALILVHLVALGVMIMGMISA